jgi:hypothetical protein
LTVLDPFALPPDPPSAPVLLSLDRAVLGWNARAKHLLRERGWPVHGGMTLHTLDTMREWVRALIRAHQPAGFHLSLPAGARVPDLTSPNACLLASAILPELRACGADLFVTERRDPEPGCWEPAPTCDGDAALAGIHRALAPAQLWLVHESGPARLFRPDQ